MTPMDAAPRLRRQGVALEVATLGWNVVGVVVLAIAGLAASSVALIAFGLDSLIEIGASIVVIWELSGTGEARQKRALTLIGVAFTLLGAYVLIQSIVSLATQHHPAPSGVGTLWTGLTVLVMFGLATGKGRTGRALGNEVLITESRVTFVDAVLAAAVLVGLVLDAALGWWWADPLAGLVIVFYAGREAVTIFRHH